MQSNTGRVRQSYSRKCSVIAPGYRSWQQFAVKGAPDARVARVFSDVGRNINGRFIGCTRPMLRSIGIANYILTLQRDEKWIVLRRLLYAFCHFFRCRRNDLEGNERLLDNGRIDISNGCGVGADSITNIQHALPILAVLQQRWAAILTSVFLWLPFPRPALAGRSRRGRQFF